MQLCANARTYCSYFFWCILDDVIKYGENLDLIWVEKFRCVTLLKMCARIHRRTDGRMDGRTDRQTDRGKGGQTDRRTD